MRQIGLTTAERDKTAWAVNSEDRGALSAIVAHVRGRIGWADYLNDDEITAVEAKEVADYADALCFTLQQIYDRLEL